jgi:hypothetical protein
MTNVEDKANKIPRKLTGICPVCKNLNATFIHFGSQPFNEKLEPLYIGNQNFKIPNPMELYNCDNCNANYELNSLIKKYNAKIVD